MWMDKKYLMCPYAGTGGDISASGVPFYVGHAVVIFGVHEHQIRGEGGITFGLVALVI